MAAVEGAETDRLYAGWCIAAALRGDAVTDEGGTSPTREAWIGGVLIGDAIGILKGR